MFVCMALVDNWNSGDLQETHEERCRNEIKNKNKNEKKSEKITTTKKMVN